MRMPLTATMMSYCWMPAREAAPQSEEEREAPGRTGGEEQEAEEAATPA